MTDRTPITGDRVTVHRYGLANGAGEDLPGVVTGVYPFSGWCVIRLDNGRTWHGPIAEVRPAESQEPHCPA